MRPALLSGSARGARRPPLESRTNALADIAHATRPTGRARLGSSARRTLTEAETREWSGAVSVSSATGAPRHRHAHVRLTLEVYSDLFDDDLDAVANSLDHELAATEVVKLWSDDDPEND